jgi:predicted amidohydrolase YtcJ
MFLPGLRDADSSFADCPLCSRRRLRYNGRMSDLLITNAQILTLDPRRPRANKLLARDGRIVALDDAVPHAADVPAYDLGGKTVVPGFIDSHVHFLWTGVQQFALDFQGVTSVPAVQELVAEQVRQQPPGHLIMGLLLDHEAFADGPPSAADLDAVAPKHPVVIKGHTGHLTIANSFAMRQLGIGPQISGWHANGTLVGAANTATAWSVPADFAAQIGWQRVFGSAAAQAARVGITTIHALEGSDQPQDHGVDALLAHTSSLPLRIVLYWQTTHVDAVLRLGLPRIGGCIWIDGDFSPHTAALKEPYADCPCSCGELYFPDERLQAFIDAANAAGLQVALHCVGDAAVDQVLRAYRGALARHPRSDHRHRVEHFEIYDDDLLRAARELGVSAAIQPAFDGYFGGIENNARYLGWERARRADPIATFDRHGIPIGGGSDSTVTPLGPLYGIHCAVNHSNPSERVSVERALRLWTIDNARLAFEEAEKGTLEPGKLADLVVLDADPLSVPPGALQNIVVELTVMGGNVTYARSAGQEQA